jgi:hypothetical protein
MSILWSLRKLVDPERRALEETDRRIERERPRAESDGATPPEAGPPTHECRVCGYLGRDGSYCPTCLAGTMRPIARRR